VPGVFPPVLIDVEAGGQHYQEMHVDGGAMAQTFLYPPQIGTLVNLRQGPLARERHAYVIRCGRLDADWASKAPRQRAACGAWCRALEDKAQTVWRPIRERRAQPGVRIRCG